jgi:Zn2+/Cd2+-exporting ATPase
MATTQQSAASTRFRVGGMDCAACASKIDTAVRRVGGVHDVSVSVTAGTMTVHHASAAVVAPAVAKAVTALGYTVADMPTNGSPAVKGSAGGGRDDENDGGLHSHDHGAPHEGPWWQSPKAKLTLACGAAVAMAYLVAMLAPGLGIWPYVVSMGIGLIPIAQRAYQAARAGTPFSIETLMTIAAVGAVFIGAAEEAAAVVVLFLIGELLEGVAAGRARASIRALTTLVPKTALLENGGTTREVPADSLAIGATILVRPGDRIPADGTILTGDSSVDEAPVTGESTPKRKAAGDTVFAGTINVDGALRVTVTAAAADNTIARVVRLVEEAQEAKAPTERFIDTFSKYYTPLVLLAGALVAVVPPLLFGGIWGDWIYKGLAILLIGCPCALVISVPAAIAAGLASGARRGLLLKGGTVLETIGKITTVAFDKTGTLTEGKPKVTDIFGVGRSEAETLAAAAALETGSSHPLAKAILARATADKVTVPAATGLAAIGGKGIVGTIAGVEWFFGSPKAAEARGAKLDGVNDRVLALNDEGKTVSVLLAGTELAGVFAMRDEPRADAKAGVKELAAMGVSTVMLTGDNRRTAAAIAKSLGMEARAELLPEDKLRIVEELKRAGQVVAKVGDGINDAPALAAADVGIAMGGGTDVALETADAAVLHGRVRDVAAMVDLSRRTMSNINTNIVIALGLKAVFLVTTVLGITGLWPAILADTGATVLVTLNALRLLQIPGDFGTSPSSASGLAGGSQQNSGTALNLLTAAWVIALSASLGALFIGEVLGQAPCNLCWFQRAFMFPLAVILAVACYVGDTSVWRYALPLVAAGWLVAAYHTLLYIGFIPAALVPCGEGPSCSSANMLVLGMPIPLLSLAAFSAVIALLAAVAQPGIISQLALSRLAHTKGSST